MRSFAFALGMLACASCAALADDGPVPKSLDYIGVGVGLAPFALQDQASKQDGQPKEPFVLAVRVAEIVCGSPAHKAGVKIGDLIDTVDLKPLSEATMAGYEAMVKAIKDGEEHSTVDLVLVRETGRNIEDVKVTLSREHIVGQLVDDLEKCN